MLESYRPITASVRGADDEQRLSFGPVIFLLEVANLFESRHIPKDVGVDCNRMHSYLDI